MVGIEGSSSIYTLWIEGTREVVRERNVQLVEDSEPYDGHKHAP